MAADLEEEARGEGMLRGIFDQALGAPVPSREDLLARAEIALAERMRWLRRSDDRAAAHQGARRWALAYLSGYLEGREVTHGGPFPAALLPSSSLLPRELDYVCPWCRAAVAAEVSGFDLDEEGVIRALGDDDALDRLARELGADIAGHRCAAREDQSDCACGCAVWREGRRGA